jgi:hypothetical protein
LLKWYLIRTDLQYVTFDAFFNHTLMHEMSHGVGPGFIKVDGRDTEVKKELKETYSTLEECKADILGMYNNMFMIEKGVYPAEIEKDVWVTFLAGAFRSMRFGITKHMAEVMPSFIITFLKKVLMSMMLKNKK